MKNLKGQATTLTIIFIVLVSAASFGYLYLQNRDLKSQLGSGNETTSTPIPPKPITNPSVTLNPTDASREPNGSAETGGWKTYTNTTHRYSIKYPLEFNLVKGPGANLPDVEFQKIDNVSFSGMQKSDDPYAGVVFAINANPQNANGKPIQCTTNDECLRKWVSVLNMSANQVSYVYKTIMGKNTKGFEYQSKNSLYTQTFQYFVYPVSNKVWLVSLTMNNYTAAEVTGIFDQVLSTFKFL